MKPKILERSSLTVTNVRLEAAPSLGGWALLPVSLAKPGTSPRPTSALMVVLFVLAVGIVGLAGCEKREPVAPKPTPSNSTPATAAATITAEPNPVPADSDNGTTITWNAGAGSTGEVYLFTRDGGEKLFGGHAPKGRQEVPWIRAGGVYEFRLYDGKEHTKLLASVKVTREKHKKE